MRLLITGANGQLGNSIRKLSEDFEDFDFIYTDQADLDITDKQAIIDLLKSEKIDGLINCAAYTAVDKAEEDEELAFLINETGPANLAAACDACKCYLIHISTDYVFSGQAFKPYQISDPIDPASVYGKSKAAGEAAIQSSNANAWIIRTSWLYSEFGNNFVKTMLSLGKSRPELKIVADQIGSPTYAVDLAYSILRLFEKVHSGHIESVGTKTYHYSNSGAASWFDFTKAIMEVSGLNCSIKPIPSEDYPLPAPRPYYSILNTSDIRRDLQLEIPYWRESLKYCIETLLNQ